MKALIGYTGFVGQNLLQQTNFNDRYNSKNISEIKNKKYDLVVCAGVSAVKWLANQKPEDDLANIQHLIENLKLIKSKQFVLISTIDIYNYPFDVNETTSPDVSKLDTYGKNRFYLENWVKNNFNNAFIIRLPALFGVSLKKNFLYDILNPVPKTYTDKLWQQILESDIDKHELKELIESYQKNSDGNYVLNIDLTEAKINSLKSILIKYGYTSMIFTDYRSSYPFYNLDNLWKDICFAMKKKYYILNLAVEPLSCAEIAKECLNYSFNNIIDSKDPVNYDMKSIYYKDFNGVNGYLYSRATTIEMIKKFFSHNGGL